MIIGTLLHRHIIRSDRQTVVRLEIEVPEHTPLTDVPNEGVVVALGVPASAPQAVAVDVTAPVEALAPAAETFDVPDSTDSTGEL